MDLLFFDPESQMALATTPFFPKEEETRSLPAVTEGILEENQTYYVRFYRNQIPDFFLDFKERNSIFCRAFPGGLFEIRFRNSVGLTRIGAFRIQIRNQKVNDQIYQAMLNFLSRKISEMVFSFNKITGQSYTKDAPGQSVPYIEYLFLKTYLMNKPDDLTSIASLITADPHHRLFSEYELVDPDQATKYDVAMLLDLVISGRYSRTENKHLSMKTSLGRRLRQNRDQDFFPNEIRVERNYHTMDTHENRFLKFFLQNLIKRLSTLLSQGPWISDSYLNPDIKKNVNSMIKGITSFLSASFWNEVGPMNFIPANSQVLQRRDGYRHLFRLYSLLQLVTKCDFRFIDFDQLLEIKDTPTLFEYWCFFLVKDLIERKRRAVAWDTQVVEQVWERSLAASLNIEYEDGVILSFNRIFSGSRRFHPSHPPEHSAGLQESYSFPYRPDIVITWKGKRLILDAKYKGLPGRFYGENDQGVIGRPQHEDIGKMHTYREAIRDISAAFILYPGTESFCFSAHQTQHPFEGVGALALRPAVDGSLEIEHLKNLVFVLDNFFKCPTQDKYNSSR